MQTMNFGALQALMGALAHYQALGEAVTNNFLQAFGLGGLTSRKGASVASLRFYAVLFVVVGVTFAIGLRILGGVGNEINDSTAQQGVTEAVNAILTFTQWLGLIALIIVAGIIIRHVTGFGKQASGGSRGKA